MRVKSGNEERIFKYVTDCFGSVIEVKELVDGALESRLKCSYDAWGNRTVSGGTAITIDGYSILMSNLNPFYYRGYYYDIETKFYYLQTRYYDPALGRFINPDVLDYLEPETINGVNLYAYCLNNPIMNVDPTGHSVKSAIKNIGNWFKDNNIDILIGAAATILAIGIAVANMASFGLATALTGMVVGAAFGTINAVMTGDDILYGALSGALLGVVGGLGGYGSSIAVAAGAFTMSLIGDKVNGREKNHLKAGISAVTAGAFSFLGSKITGLYGKTRGVEKAVVDSLGTFIFNSYTFVTDTIFDYVKQRA